MTGVREAQRAGRQPAARRACGRPGTASRPPAAPAGQPCAHLQAPLGSPPPHSWAALPQKGQRRNEGAVGSSAQRAQALQARAGSRPGARGRLPFKPLPSGSTRHWTPMCSTGHSCRAGSSQSYFPPFSFTHLIPHRQSHSHQHPLTNHVPHLVHQHLVPGARVERDELRGQGSRQQGARQGAAGAGGRQPGQASSCSSRLPAGGPPRLTWVRLCLPHPPTPTPTLPAVVTTSSLFITPQVSGTACRGGSGPGAGGCECRRVERGGQGLRIRAAQAPGTAPSPAPAPAPGCLPHCTGVQRRRSPRCRQWSGRPGRQVGGGQ